MLIKFIDYKDRDIMNFLRKFIGYALILTLSKPGRNTKNKNKKIMRKQKNKSNTALIFLIRIFINQRDAINNVQRNRT